MLMALTLGSVGLVMLLSAFTSPPDPRIVLRDLITRGGSGVGEAIAGATVDINPDARIELVPPRSRMIAPEITPGTPS